MAGRKVRKTRQNTPKPAIYHILATKPAVQAIPAVITDLTCPFPDHRESGSDPHISWIMPNWGAPEFVGFNPRSGNPGRRVPRSDRAHRSLCPAVGSARLRGDLDPVKPSQTPGRARPRVCLFVDDAARFPGAASTLPSTSAREDHTPRRGGAQPKAERRTGFPARVVQFRSDAQTVRMPGGESEDCPRTTRRAAKKMSCNSHRPAHCRPHTGSLCVGVVVPLTALSVFQSTPSGHPGDTRPESCPPPSLTDRIRP